MKLLKPIIIVGGLAALVIVTYFGFGVSHQQNVVQAQDNKQTSTPIDLATDKAKLGYTVGVQIANDIARSGLTKEIDLDAFLAAQRDVIGGAEPRLSVEQMQAAQQTYQLRQQQLFAALAAENKTKGEAFLEKNKTEKDVVIADSGLQYQVVREGKGKQPGGDDTVTVHYLGSLIDGTTFDSSYERNQPADFPVSAVIPGFSEGLKLMKEGAKYRFVIPSDIAYGENGPPGIGPNQTLVFEVELIAVK